MGVSTRAMPATATWRPARQAHRRVDARFVHQHGRQHGAARGGVKALEVSFVGVGMSASALAALRSGQIDAMSNTEPVMTMLEQKGDVKIISDTRTLKGTQEVFGGPMPACACTRRWSS
jgi:NitT/TauT family transport system substrate-binding protein